MEALSKFPKNSRVPYMGTVTSLSAIPCRRLKVFVLPARLVFVALCEFVFELTECPEKTGHGLGGISQRNPLTSAFEIGTHSSAPSVLVRRDQAPVPWEPIADSLHTLLGRCRG